FGDVIPDYVLGQSTCALFLRAPGTCSPLEAQVSSPLREEARGLVF
ncbi:ERCC1 isoform 12, partial [Pan troglodytes]